MENPIGEFLRIHTNTWNRRVSSPSRSNLHHPRALFLFTFLRSKRHHGNSTSIVPLGWNLHPHNPLFKDSGSGCGAWNRRVLEASGYEVDGGVMVAALVLEGYLEKKGSGFLVAVSLWRVVWVIESTFELSNEAIDSQIEDVVRQFDALNEENKRLLETVTEKDVVISQLLEDLERCSQPCN